MLQRVLPVITTRCEKNSGLARDKKGVMMKYSEQIEANKHTTTMIKKEEIIQINKIK
jgi:hypothetical protein